MSLSFYSITDLVTRTSFNRDVLVRFACELEAIAFTLYMMT